tara:strand:+ start:249 stop:467 length:219 start_codon:yes stop_codon:yes gene_type:complete
MHVGYQYVALNFDPRNLKCLVSVDAYYISPDKGLGIFTFDKKADLEKHINVLKDFLNTIRIDFLGRQVFKLE